MQALGGPLLYAFYLRLLGARIGKNVLILSRSFPVCTDLVEIGDDTFLAEGHPIYHLPRRQRLYPDRVGDDWAQRLRR